MKFQKHTLPNGVRIIVVPAHDNPSATVMVACETGSNYESKKENGLSHFLEHMLFKGTTARPTAFSVSSELDAVGAESNAFTSSEVTGYHAKSEKRHWKKLLEVISDIYLNPAFQTAEIEKERGVIIQEIGMYQDLPHRHVWDLFSKLAYSNTPAGRSIIGPKENIRRFSRQDFLAFHRKHYVSSKTIVAIAGDVAPKAAIEEVEKIFGLLSPVERREKDKVVEKQKRSGFLLEKKKTDQTHMVMGFRGYDAKDRRSIVATLLMGILGDGMSSRLFQRLREEMGACYYVRTQYEALTDHGMATIATGINPKRAEEVVRAILDECRRMTYEKVSEKELQKGKDYLASHMYMALETTDALAGFYIGEEITQGEARNPQELEKEVRGVTAEEIMEVAKELFRNEKLNLAIVGNLSDPKPVKKALTFK
jgi:predicted Zn-dependent peptidase